MAVTVEAMAADMEVTGEATAATVITTESAMLKPLPLLSLDTVMDMEDTVIMAVTAVMAMAVTDTAMASVMLSLAMAVTEAMAVTVEAMAADTAVTGEAMAATVTVTAMASGLLSLVMAMEATEEATEATEEAMAATDTVVTGVATAVMVMATANKKCHSIVVSFTNVGRADRQNFVNIHSESLFCLLLCKFYAWEM